MEFNNIMYTLREIRDLRIRAINLKLHGREILDKYSDIELQHIFNGIGPDRFPPELRDIIDIMHPSLVVVAFIHDIRFEEGGTETDFKDANAEFRDNGYIAAKADYAWYNPLRYRVRFFADKFAKLCDKFGWSGYNKIEAVDNCTDTKGKGLEDEKTE